MIKGIGVDIIKNSRVDLKVAQSLLSKKEYQYYQTLNDALKYEMLASRFAAKEAIIKATDKRYSFKDINLEKAENGRLVCTNIKHIHLSIAHEKEYSIAYAVYEE